MQCLYFGFVFGECKPHFSRASGDDHASTGVPPQFVETKPNDSQHETGEVSCVENINGQSAYQLGNPDSQRDHVQITSKQQRSIQYH